MIGAKTQINDDTVISKSMIGKNCIIGNNVTIKSSHIMNNVVIKDNCKINNSFIDDNCVIEEGCIIDCGTIIASNVKVEARTELTGNILESTEKDQGMYVFTVFIKNNFILVIIFTRVCISDVSKKLIQSGFLSKGKATLCFHTQQHHGISLKSYS